MRLTASLALLLDASFDLHVLQLRVYQLQRRISADPLLREALNDERIRQARARAFTIGFVVLAAYLALLRVGEVLVSVSIGFAAQLGIFLAVLVPIGSFLFLDRSEPDEG